MKIYRVRPDVNHFQYFMLEDSDIGLTEMMKFNSHLKNASWIAPDVFVYKPRHKKGNFYGLWATAAFVVEETALEKIRDLLEMSGELLPLPYKDKLYYVMNVTECVNVLDERKTLWRYEKGTLPIEKYDFTDTECVQVPSLKSPKHAIMKC